MIHKKNINGLNVQLNKLSTKQKVLQQKSIDFTTKYGTKTSLLTESQLKRKNNLKEKYKQNKIEITKKKNEIKNFLKKKGGTNGKIIVSAVQHVDNIVANIIIKEDEKELKDTLKKTLKDTLEDTLKEYFNSFQSFVFKGVSYEMGMGAYLISSIVMLVDGENVIEGLTDDNRTQEKTLIENHKDLLGYAKIRSNIQKINNFTQVTHFHQSPFLLGFFSFIDDKSIAGSCQDTTLLNMIFADKSCCLTGFNVYGCDLASDHTHWSTSQNMETSTGRIQFHIGKDGLKPEECLGKRVKNLINTKKQKTNNTLFKADVSCPIKKTDYDSRAIVFLAITLSHVYRHINIQDNKSNGIAFRESFVKSILNKVIETTWYSTQQGTYANTNAPKSFPFEQKTINFIKELDTFLNRETAYVSMDIMECPSLFINSKDDTNANLPYSCADKAKASSSYSQKSKKVS